MVPASVMPGRERLALDPGLDPQHLWVKQLGRTGGKLVGISPPVRGPWQKAETSAGALYLSRGSPMLLLKDLSRYQQKSMCTEIALSAT